MKQTPDTMGPVMGDRSGIGDSWSSTVLDDMGVEPKIGGKPPKWMVYNGKPY